MIIESTVLALPHSSAAAERIFSELNNTKTAIRKRLLMKTCSAILRVKDVRESKCVVYVGRCIGYKLPVIVLIKGPSSIVAIRGVPSDSSSNFSGKSLTPCTS
ncbi:hypothetical protein JTB14_004342 [Gonioctena quinquepunctata]|nr:hypothetical protein JTB14_004342 [Gonioctena quinquepunctata]